jgi:hypothetical protein
MDTVERVEGGCFLLDSSLAITPSTLLQNRIFRPRHKKTLPFISTPAFMFLHISPSSQPTSGGPRSSTSLYLYSTAPTLPSSVPPQNPTNPASSLPPPVVGGSQSPRPSPRPRRRAMPRRSCRTTWSATSSRYPPTEKAAGPREGAWGTSTGTAAAGSPALLAPRLAPAARSGSRRRSYSAAAHR